MIPYIVGHPIKNRADFYGRSLEVSRFYEVIAGQQAQSLSLVGVRRAGKTSFLLHVSQPELMQTYLDDPDQTVMVYLDMSFCKTPAEFYGRFAQRLRQILDGDTSRRATSDHRASVYVVEDLLCQFAGRRVILLLDEFDQLRIGSFDEDFLNELRSLITHWEYEMACVTASYWSLYQLGAHIGLPPTSPFYNIFYPSPIFMAGLKGNAWKQLICRPAQQIGLSLAEEDIAAIQLLAGTLPFFVQATAVSWLRDKLDGLIPFYGAQLAQLTEQLTPYFAQWWRLLDEAEKGVLQMVAQEEPIEQTRHLVQAQRQLLRYGLLVQHGNKTAVNGAVFANWLHEYARHQTAAPTAERRLARPSYDVRALRQALVKHFSIEELNLLTFDLGMDFEQFPGQTKGAKARDLVVQSERRGILPQLVEAIQFERGDVIR